MPGKPLFEDTSPEAEAILIEGMRRMTPAQKMARTQALTLSPRYTQEQDVARMHPAGLMGTPAPLRSAMAWTRVHSQETLGWDPDPDLEGY